MSKAVVLNVRVSGGLSEFVTENLGPNGRYDNASEYVRDLIRRDKERVEAIAFEKLKAELQRAFAVPDEEFESVTAKEVIARNRAKRT